MIQFTLAGQINEDIHLGTLNQLLIIQVYILPTTVKEFRGVQLNILTLGIVLCGILQLQSSFMYIMSIDFLFFKIN